MYGGLDYYTIMYWFSKELSNLGNLYFFLTSSYNAGLEVAFIIPITWKDSELSKVSKPYNYPLMIFLFGIPFLLGFAGYAP